VKDGLRNVGVYFLTKSAHCGVILTDLKKKLKIKPSEFLDYAYEKAMSKRNEKGYYNYLILDLSPACAHENRVRSGLFPGEIGRIYRP